MIGTKRRRRRSTVSRGERSGIANAIAKTTVGHRPAGLRVDFRRLPDEDDERELIALTRKLVEGGGHNFERLTERERSKWERLVEQGAGLDAGYFKAKRKEEETMREITRLATLAMRPAQKSALLPAGTVVLPAELGKDLREGRLWLNHATVIVGLLYQFEAATPFARQATFEGEGDTLALVVDALYSPFGRAAGEDEVLTNWKTLLEELGPDWFAVERHGRTWRVRRGPRALAAGRAS